MISISEAKRIREDGDDKLTILELRGLSTDEKPTDEVNNTVSAKNVYFNKCSDKRNIIFNNMCWQMIRTTETGGIKMIYNGEPVDGKCESTRGTHKGIVQSNDGISQSINSSYLYGSSFTYNKSTNEFKLIDTVTSTWSDSTYQDLLGKFKDVPLVDKDDANSLIYFLYQLCDKVDELGGYSECLNHR